MADEKLIERLKAERLHLGTYMGLGPVGMGALLDAAIIALSEQGPRLPPGVTVTTAEDGSIRICDTQADGSNNLFWVAKKDTIAQACTARHDGLFRLLSTFLTAKPVEATISADVGGEPLMRLPVEAKPERESLRDQFEREFSRQWKEMDGKPADTPAEFRMLYWLIRKLDGGK